MPWVFAHYFTLCSARQAGDADRSDRVIARLGASADADVYLDGLSIESVPACELERQILRESMALVAEPVEALGLGATLAHHAAPARAAIELLRTLDAEIADEVDALVGRVSLLAHSPLVSMTDVRSFGRVYVRRAESSAVAEATLHYLELLVHEVSHLRLNITNSPDELYAAPFRLDPRPMYGVMHATFVLGRIVRVFERLARSRQRSAAGLARLTASRQRFRRGLATVRQHARFTELGSSVSHSMLGLTGS